MEKAWGRWRLVGEGQRGENRGTSVILLTRKKEKKEKKNALKPMRKLASQREREKQMGRRLKYSTENTGNYIVVNMKAPGGHCKHRGGYLVKNMVV